MFKKFLRYIADPEQLKDFLDLKEAGLTDEEIESYFKFFSLKIGVKNEWSELSKQSES